MLADISKPINMQVSPSYTVVNANISIVRSDVAHLPGQGPGPVSPRGERGATQLLSLPQRRPGLLLPGLPVQLHQRTGAESH